MLRELADVIARLFSVRFAKLDIGKVGDWERWEYIPERLWNFRLGNFSDPATHGPKQPGQNSMLILSQGGCLTWIPY